MSAFEGRLQRIREHMVKESIDGLFLMMSSDLQYLTGVRRQPHNPTDDDKHGDELYGAFLTPECGPIFVVPRMGASSYVRNQSEGRPWIEDIVVIDDGEEPLAVARDVLRRLGDPVKLGVSGRLWARSLFLLKEARPELAFVDASPMIARMRAIKDAEETRVMKEAGLITDRVFAAVLKQLRPGMTEYDIAREVDHQVIVCGGSGVSFHTGIVVGGEDICRIHAQDRKTGDTAVVPGASITFDFGVLWQGYASDFGRTVFCGEPTKEYRDYHDLVMRAQSEAIAVMRPGQITASELNRTARRVIEDAGVGDYFTHRLGHGIGIDVHEPPFLYELDHTVLEAGMCFTIEPSIRVPGGIGVRVEDVVQVTEEGGVSFSNFSRDYLVI